MKRKSSRKDILEPVSAALGNTPAIARSAYIHPGLLDLAAAPEQRKRMKLPTRRATKYLSATERTLIDILDKLAKRR